MQVHGLTKAYVIFLYVNVGSFDLILAGSR